MRGSGKVQRAVVVAVGLALVLSCANFVVAGGAQAAVPPVGSTSTFLGNGVRGPQAIATGPDGALWFTNSMGRSIGRLTTAGVFSNYFDAALREPAGITAGPDGAMWFTDRSAGLIGRINMAGTISTFSSGAVATPSRITTGVDGRLWFTDRSSQSIGRITTAGVLSSIDDPMVAGTSSVTAGPDGNMWFASTYWKQVGRISASGVVTTFAMPDPYPPVNYQPDVIVAGPDGNLWFTLPLSYQIGRITTGGALTFFGGIGSDPTDLVNGPDGALWFTTAPHGPLPYIERISTSGVVTKFQDPAAWKPTSIATGPDGALWFTDNYRHGLGRMTPSGVVTTFAGTDLSYPSSIVASPGGDLWFIRGGLSMGIGRVTLSGQISMFTDLRLKSPDWLTPGPDGAMWFTDANAGAIGRITSAGTISMFTDPLIENPFRITAGPDGALWFVNHGGVSIGRISTAGVVSDIGVPGTSVNAITSGADGALWFTDGYGNSVRRMTTGGVITKYSDANTQTPGGVIPGPDGALWFRTDKGVGRITVDGVTSQITAPVGSAFVFGPDGALWFTQYGVTGRTIGRMSLDGFVSTIAGPTSVSGVAPGPDGALWFTTSYYGDGSIGRLQVVGVPTAPQAVQARPGPGSASVTWLPPILGSAPVTSYTVTATPGGATCTWTTGPLTCSFSSLHAGTPYTFIVRAVNAKGTSPPSAGTTAVVPWSGSGYHASGPLRLLDSRTTTGGWTGKLVAGAPRMLHVVNELFMPKATTAVVANITVTDGDANSFLSTWPAGQPQPPTSSINFGRGETIANSVTVPVGPEGDIQLANAVGATHVVVDLVGWFDESSDPGELFTPIAPVRALDSRSATGGWTGPLGPGQTRSLAVRGGTVPNTAAAAVLNVTATASTAGSFLEVWPSQGLRPTASNLNFGPGQTIANLTTVPIGSDGAVSIYNAVGSTHVVVDVVGYFDRTGGSRFHPLNSPTRVLDDRTGLGLAGPWGPNQSRTLDVAGRNGISSAANGIVMNTTVTNATDGSFVTVYPGPGAAPTSSSINFAAGQTIANLTMTGLDPTGKLAIYNRQGHVDVVGDAVGYFAVDSA